MAVLEGAGGISAGEGDSEVVEEIRVGKNKIKYIERYKDEIEKLGNVKITIEGNTVRISGDALSCYTTKRVIKSLARCFKKEDAFLLFNEDYVLYVIPISKNKRALYRIRSRLIGTRGRVKRKIEQLTRTKISVYGKTVSIIGRGEEIEIARTAIEKIIAGASHSKVFGFIRRSLSEIEG